MACLCIYHPDIEEFIEAKSYDKDKLTQFNLSVMIDDDFMYAVKNDENIFLHYPCMDEKGNIENDVDKWIIKKEVRARDLWDKIMDRAYNYGDPGCLYVDNFNKDNNLYYMENIVTTNPCFTGDMRLLTDKGYKTFEKLCNKKVNIINHKGEISQGTVWCTGIKETIKLIMSSGKIITCTPNHKFMLSDGTECKAECLKGKWIQKSDKDKIDKVIEVIENGKQLVYDFNEPNTHWGIVEGYVAHNCGEYVSGTLDVNDGKEYMGACNLGSLFLHNYIENPFTEDAYFDFEKLKQVIPIAVRMLDNIIDINYYPLEAFENYQKNVRTIGLGITGLHNMLWMLGLDYESKESLEFVDNLMDFIVYHTYCASVELAKEKGAFNFFDKKYADSNFIKKHIEKGNQNWKSLRQDILKYGIRNGRMISVAPCGTLSLTFGENCSSGLEPTFDLEYDRTVRVGGQEERNEKKIHMIDYAYDVWKNTENSNVKENVFDKTALNLSVESHLNMLKTITFHVDMSASKTINVPTETTFEEVKDLFYDCWKNGIKGCTIFRPNELREGILLSNKNKLTQQKELQRGEWDKIPSDTVYIRRKIHTGCGKLVLFVGYSESEDRITDFYIKRSANGGCVHNIDAVVISMSGMMRLGGSLDNIEKAFRGCGTCNSFTTAKLKGKKLSEGKSCPTAILNAIKDVENEIKSRQLTQIFKDTPQLKSQLEEAYDEVRPVFSDEEKEFIKENGEIAFALATNKCPTCGSELQNSGGCIICNNCGFTKCE